MENLLIQSQCTEILKKHFPSNLKLNKLKTFKELTFYYSKRLFYFDSLTNKMKFKKCLSLYVSSNGNIIFFGKFNDLDEMNFCIDYRIINDYEKSNIKELINVLNKP